VLSALCARKSHFISICNFKHALQPLAEFAKVLAKLRQAAWDALAERLFRVFDPEATGAVDFARFMTGTFILVHRVYFNVYIAACVHNIYSHIHTPHQ
jgi:Ca2+-binding EF-hand superfamily protein